MTFHTCCCVQPLLCFILSFPVWILSMCFCSLTLLRARGYQCRLCIFIDLISFIIASYFLSFFHPDIKIQGLIFCTINVNSAMSFFYTQTKVCFLKVWSYSILKKLIAWKGEAVWSDIICLCGKMSATVSFSPLYIHQLKKKVKNCSGDTRQIYMRLITESKFIINASKEMPLCV